MTARTFFGAEVKVLATATKISLATVSNPAFNFGTPNDINLNTITAAAPGLGYTPGMRLLLVIDGTTVGTTDSTSIQVQDAPDSGTGTIGTPVDLPATNYSVVTGAIAASTGDKFFVSALITQPNRPWIRVKLNRAAGTTDTLVAKAWLLGIPVGLI